MTMTMTMTQRNNNSKAEEEDNDGDVDEEDKEAVAAAGEGKGGVDDRDNDDDDDDNDRIICRTQLGTILKSYPWRGNSYSRSSQERREKCCGIIIICMVPIGQYIIHRTRHTQY